LEAFEMIFTPAEPQKIFLDHLQREPKCMGFISMGVGKTAAVLQHISNLLLDATIVGALVVAPLRVASLTWPNEVHDWDQFRWMKVANLRTESGQRAFLQGRAHVYTCNYESLHLLVSLIQRRKNTLPYDLEVWDESTRAKNPSSKRINNFRRNAPRTDRRISLTGTPAPNSHLDIFAQVRLIDDGERLGSNFLIFKKTHYFAPFMPFQPWKPKAGTDKLIEEKISDITCTLRAVDWLNIPDTVFEDVEIKFDPALQEKYETLEKELVIELRNKTMNVANSAALITKLLQFTSGHVYCDEKATHPVHRLKLEALKKIAVNEKSPLIVSYQFKHEAEWIKQEFPHARFFTDCKRSSHNQTVENEKRLIREWNEGKIKMLVGHPASISHGLNLQYGSNALVFTTLTYNREQYEQFIGRLARRGQTQVVKVYRLMVENTVDWAVAEALAAKTENEQRLISALQMLESMRNK
jgi:SNF2 family DNA or RNA helicase